MSAALDTIVERVAEVILGKDHQIKLATTCLLARGHLLIEDLPGVGKTTLAQSLARTLGLDFARVQFTSDLLPADVLGINVFERQGNAAQGAFVFQPGPVFTQILLADEVNRASPKTQSALLEAMEEGHVTVDGVTRQLPQPFFLIATQNPGHQVGTFALPESQLDRFLMRIELGFPPNEAEHDLIKGRERRDLLAELRPALDAQELIALQARAQRVHVADPLVSYLLALLQHSRRDRRYGGGLSPRAGLALKRCAQAWAMLNGRDAVIPEDVQAVWCAVCAHRLEAAEAQTDQRTLAAELLAGVPVD